MDNKYQGLRIDEIAQAKKEEDFLEEINQDSGHPGEPLYYFFNSVEDVIDNHDCTASPEDGCFICGMLQSWGFIDDGYDPRSMEGNYE